MAARDGFSKRTRIRKSSRPTPIDASGSCA
jgi:hypothetical protein